MPDNTPETIRIDIPAVACGYDILIGEGLLNQAGQLIKDRLGEKRCLIITDSNVAPLLLQKTEKAMVASNHIVGESIVLPAGEGTKSLPVLHELMGQIFDRRIDRGSVLIALGGGVIGDLVGFAASITLRGIDFVQIPTTLLSQVDSSVGGKTGINSVYGKNTVGTFYQPRLVIADINALDTLSQREISAGYGEIVKYGLVADTAFFRWCQNHAAQLLFGNKAARIQAVYQSCLAKSQIVAEDEKEKGRRALLNLGHTFAHALESSVGYDSDKLLHGEAVIIGIAMAFRLSVEMGLCAKEDEEIVVEHFRTLHLSTVPPQADYNINQLMDLMVQDKKAKNGHLTFVLVRGLGQGFVCEDVDPALVRKVWQGFL